MEKEKNSKKFIIKFIIFSIVLITITIIGICVKINKINQEIQPIEKTEKTEEVSLKETDEEKYAIKAYNETYNQNSIEIVNYYDVNGKVQISDDDIFDANVNFVQIKGLKNQSIQNAINEKLKQKAYNVKSSVKGKIDSIVKGNFGNILSVIIRDDDEYLGEGSFETLNIDLTTGKDVSLEKVFISSASINAILAQGVYKAIVWNEAAKEGFGENHDVNNYDTSQYEDVFLKFIRKYNENKDDIKFVIYPSGIEIYGMLDETILGEKVQDACNRIQIDFLDNLGEVAIYKRYLTDEDIYQNNNLGEKDVIILTEGVTVSNGEDLSKWRHRLNYGNLQDNIFIEEVVDLIEEENTKVAMDYIKSISNKEQKKLKQEINNDQGAFFQKYYSINEEDNYYYISIDTSKDI